MWRSRGLCALPSFCRQTNLKEVERWVTAGGSPQGNTCGTISSSPPSIDLEGSNHESQITIISNLNYLKSQLSQLLILNSQLSFTARISSWLSVRNKDFLQVSVPKFPLKAPVIWQFQNLVLLLRRQGPDTENRETTREHKPPSPPPRQGRARCRKEERSYALFR